MIHATILGAESRRGPRGMTRIAELLRLTNFMPAHVNLLTRAGVDSLDQLRDVSPAGLGALFTDWAAAGETVPEAATLDAWAIEIAVTSSLIADEQG